MMNLPVYPYIGDADLVEHLDTDRQCVENGADVQRWAARTGQGFDRENQITTTFIVDVDGRLWIADRCSEHVACARGGSVLAAGEMTFQFDVGQVSVAAVSNQSTGYCPLPDCWPAVAQALHSAALPHPGAWTSVFLFRICTACGQKNLIKEQDFTCGVCQSSLDPDESDYQP